MIWEKKRARRTTAQLTSEMLPAKGSNDKCACTGAPGPRLEHKRLKPLHGNPLIATKTRESCERGVPGFKPIDGGMLTD